MNTAQPIKDLAELTQFKNYYKEIKPNERNSLLIVIGLNAALRMLTTISYSRLVLLCYLRQISLISWHYPYLANWLIDDRALVS